MDQFLKIILFTLIFSSVHEIYAQNRISNVDINRIKQKKVRKLIQEQQVGQIEFFTDFEASVGHDNDLAHFLAYEKEYIVKEQPEVVWDNYIYSSQTEIWDNHRVSFGMLYSKKSEEIVYDDEFYFGIEKGQIFFLNLKILNGLYHLPVAFMILKVDPDQKLLEFSYLKGGKACGKQIISMTETEKGYSKIVHKSYVNSNSKFRDKYVYPFFHNKIINEFHLNMRKMITYRAKKSFDTLSQAK